MGATGEESERNLPPNLGGNLIAKKISSWKKKSSSSGITGKQIFKLVSALLCRWFDCISLCGPAFKTFNGTLRKESWRKTVSTAEKLDAVFIFNIPFYMSRVMRILVLTLWVACYSLILLCL
jgi:hypothetical protein